MLNQSATRNWLPTLAVWSWAMLVVDPVWSQASSPLPEATTATSSAVSAASPPIAAPGPDTQQALQSLMAMDAGDGLNQQLRKLALQHLPESYVDDRKWDRTETIKTLIPRSEPLVMKHGTWTKYELTPVDPERTLAIRLTNVRHNEDDRLAFNLACDLTVDLEARQARWQRGVQLYSLKADITARVTVELDCRLGLRLDLKSEPAVVLAPHVQATQVTLHEFRIHRISKVGGEFAQQATKAARKWLEEHASDHEAKLTESINKQLQKKPEKLRIALSK